ncbi:hypothetical protein LCGC14_2586000, partial [marine sediment metagenome]
MARYIGDLTSPDRHKERECAAQMLDNIARRIRDCQIRSVSVGSSRDVDSRDWPLGVPPILSAWDIDMTYQANPHVEQPCGDNPQPCGCNRLVLPRLSRLVPTHMGSLRERQGRTRRNMTHEYALENDDYATGWWLLWRIKPEMAVKVDDVAWSR